MRRSLLRKARRKLRKLKINKSSLFVSTEMERRDCLPSLIRRIIVAECINYWLVGASWSGMNMYDDFIDNGYWQLGETGRNNRTYRLRYNQISIGDSIALKSNDGPGTGSLTVKAIGIVTNVTTDTYRLAVNWVRTGLDRKVALGGALKAIEGPYTLTEKEEWLEDIFRL